MQRSRDNILKDLLETAENIDDYDLAQSDILLSMHARQMLLGEILLDIRDLLDKISSSEGVAKWGSKL